MATNVDAEGIGPNPPDVLETDRVDSLDDGDFETLQNPGEVRNALRHVDVDPADWQGFGVVWMDIVDGEYAELWVMRGLKPEPEKPVYRVA